MLRTLAAAALLLVVPRAIEGQDATVLHIKVSVIDPERKTVPVPRHALLISDNPASAPPRRVVTTQDGTADVRLRPGNYTVESDEPLIFHGQAIHWTQTLDIVAGRDAVLELTAENAEVETATSAGATGTPTTPSDDPFMVAMQLEDSVVALWTATTHASGFVIDSKGLIATSQRSIGTATTVEVQLTPSVKVAGIVLVSDTDRDVAIVRIDPAAVASTQAIPLGCGRAQRPLAAGEKIFTIGVPLREPRGITRGSVSRLEPHEIVSDLIVADGSTGGPVFAADGSIIGITSGLDDRSDRRRGDARIVRADDACDVVASAEKKLKAAAPPAGAHLPVEPVRSYSVEDIKSAAERRATSLSPYRLSSSDFDIAFITPIMLYGEQHRVEYASLRDRGGRIQRATIGPAAVRPLEDFSNWSAYVEDVPPVLLVRVTPKQVEGFWTTVARGAAQTQGIALPPITHFKSGFSSMQAQCGDADVTPIHPFKLEQRVSESDAIYEGLYVYDLRALGPDCRTVTLRLFSEKTPDKADARAVDAVVLQQLWRDLAAYTPRQ